MLTTASSGSSTPARARGGRRFAPAQPSPLTPRGGGAVSGTTAARANDDSDETRRRRRSVIDDRVRRKSLVFSPRAKIPLSPGGTRRSRAGAAAAAADREPEFVPPVFPQSLKEAGARFEEFMKLAADNRINAGNSWNLGLIDYFHDMRLLRDGDGINFLKASCTLDGCIKIYTSRVDFVDTETRKLLSGLAENSRTYIGGEFGDLVPFTNFVTQIGKGSSSAEDGDADGEDEEKARKRKVHRIL